MTWLSSRTAQWGLVAQNAGASRTTTLSMRMETEALAKTLSLLVRRNDTHGKAE